MFVVQSNTFQFFAFFIYDQNKNPIFYTAQLTDDGTGKYTGGALSDDGDVFRFAMESRRPSTGGSGRYGDIHAD